MVDILGTLGPSCDNIKVPGANHRPLPQDDPMQRQPVTDLAKKELDWEPTIKLDESLARTIEYFRVLLGIY